VLLCFTLALAGCGEPSARELKNRQEFEALLTAVVLKNAKELERDAKRLEKRHDSGELSEARFQDLREIITRARDGNWGEAERLAYAFRERRPFFR
jgi:hypothetical protein